MGGARRSSTERRSKKLTTMLHFYRQGRGTTWPGEKADEGGEDGQETHKEEDEALVDVG